MRAYRITYDCTLPPERVTQIMAALDRMVVAAGGEPGANPTATPLDRKPFVPGELPKLKRVDGAA